MLVQSCGFVEFASSSALQSAINASPIDLGDVKIIVEERRKSGKSDTRSGKQINVDRRATSKSEDGRIVGPKRPNRTGPGQMKPKPE